MTERKRKERSARVAHMNGVLKELYPEATIALNFSNDFECLVAVELSAQCTDARVNQVTEKLFTKYPTIDAYANATQQAMEQDVYQCGFYRNKARNIIGAAKMVRDRYNYQLPRTLAELIEIPGVARKTANVILSTLYQVHEGIAVDTHVRRFAIKFDLTDHTDPVRIERDLMEIMPKSDWWGFNHRLVHYGRDYCPARPHECHEHPLTVLYPKAATVWPKSK